MFFRTYLKSFVVNGFTMSDEVTVDANGRLRKHVSIVTSLSIAASTLQKVETHLTLLH
jgi:hypothetical protein